MSQNLSLSPARLNDVEALHALVNSAYRGESSRQGWTTEADYLEGQRTDRDELRALITDGKLFALRSDTEILGCVCLETFTDARGAYGYLGMLTVKPDRQARGLGGTILKHAEDWMREREIHRMRISVVHLRDTLIAWYERHGYAATGETKPWPYGQPEFGLPLRDDLHFVLFEKLL